MDSDITHDFIAGKGIESFDSIGEWLKHRRTHTTQNGPSWGQKNVQIALKEFCDIEVSNAYIAAVEGSHLKPSHERLLALTEIFGEGEYFPALQKLCERSPIISRNASNRHTKPVDREEQVHQEIDPSIREIHKTIDAALHTVKDELNKGLFMKPVRGRLMRLDVYHFVLRAKTFFSLLRKLNPGDLYELGKEFGKSAGSDFINKGVKPISKYIDGPDKLISLWDRWDSTGGFGTMDIQKPISGLHWYIIVENSFLFLEETDAAEREKLGKIWCGYYHGFLDEAFYQNADIMKGLSEQDKKRVQLPKTPDQDWVKEVSIEPFSINNEKKLIFHVEFKKDPTDNSNGQIHTSESPDHKQQQT